MSSDYKSARGDEDNTQCDDSKSNEASFKTSAEDDDHLSDIYGKSSAEQDRISDTEENETIYIVFIEPNEHELLLVVSDQSIREKDSLSGR